MSLDTTLFLTAALHPNDNGPMLSESHIPNGRKRDGDENGTQPMNQLRARFATLIVAALGLESTESYTEQLSLFVGRDGVFEGGANYRFATGYTVRFFASRGGFLTDRLPRAELLISSQT